MRQVGRRKRECLLNVAQRRSHILARQRVHEVDIEVGKTAGMQLGRRTLRLERRMDASEGLQLPRIEALPTEGHAVDACGPVFSESPAFDRARIRLECDFRIRRDVQMPACGGQHARDGVRGKKAWRAAAQEHAQDAARADLHALECKVALQSFEVLGFGQRIAQCVGVEVAVGALGYAPWEVHVERERRQDHARVPLSYAARNCAISACSARARWLTAFFSLGASSAAVRSSPAGTNIGS